MRVVHQMMTIGNLSIVMVVWEGVERAVMTGSMSHERTQTILQLSKDFTITPTTCTVDILFRAPTKISQSISHTNLK